MRGDLLVREKEFVLAKQGVLEECRLMETKYSDFREEERQATCI